MIKDEFAIETSLSIDAATRRLATALAASRSMRFVLPSLSGFVTRHEIMLWRDRRNGAAFLYPLLRVTVRPKGSGSVLEGRFVVNLRKATIVGLWLGAFGALSILCVGMVLRSDWASGVVTALVVFLAVPFLTVAASHFWANVFTGDREILFREFSDVIRDDGV